MTRGCLFAVSQSRTKACEADFEEVRQFVPEEDPLLFLAGIISGNRRVALQPSCQDFLPERKAEMVAILCR
jgi:hypothetical protein